MATTAAAAATVVSLRLPPTAVFGDAAAAAAAPAGAAVLNLLLVEALVRCFFSAGIRGDCITNTAKSDRADASVCEQNAQACAA